MCIRDRVDALVLADVLALVDALVLASTLKLSDLSLIHI